MSGNKPTFRTTGRHFFSLSPDIEDELKEYRWNISDLFPEHNLNGKSVTVKLNDLIARETK